MVIPVPRRKQSGVRPSGQIESPDKQAQLGWARQAPSDTQLRARGSVQPLIALSWQDSRGAVQVALAAQEEVGTAKQSSDSWQVRAPQARPDPASTRASGYKITASIPDPASTSASFPPGDEPQAEESAKSQTTNKTRAMARSIAAPRA